MQTLLNASKVWQTIPAVSLKKRNHLKNAEKTYKKQIKSSDRS